MLERDLSKIQEALDALTTTQGNINELSYYRKNLKSPNHSNSSCSSAYSRIGALKKMHSETVNALLIYGGVYEGRDVALAQSNNPDYKELYSVDGFTYTPAPEHEKSGWEKFWDQILLGEFSEETTWQGVVGNILVGVVAGFFGLDAPLDIRDAAANFSKGEWGWAILDCIFLLPVIGAFKPAKYTDEVATLIKHGDDLIDVGGVIAKNSDDVLKYGDEVVDMIKHGDDVLDIGGVVAKNSDDVLKHGDEIAEIITDGSHLQGGKLKPNITYKTGEFDYIYKTDANGRICNWSTDNLQHTERTKRLSHDSFTPGKMLGDDAGHLAGDRFGGSAQIDNLVSQHSFVNKSQYKKIENLWDKAIKNNKQVTLDMSIFYDGLDKRPSGFKIEYTIDGEFFSAEFLNVGRK